MLGYNISYFLWVVKGSNNLSHLTYYSKHVAKYSDDDHTLRGAYGPRLLNWIGADQLQECIDANKDIDDEKHFGKPIGINQLQKVYEDLNGGLDVSCCQIFNPSIDFEPSKNIPDLVSIGFSKQVKNLDLTGVYTRLPVDKKDFAADKFCLSLLGSCMASILNCEFKGLFTLEYHAGGALARIGIQDCNITNKTPETLWHDIHKLCDFDKYIRNNVKKESIELPNVDTIFLVENGLKQIVGPIVCDFWKDCAYILVVTALKKYGKFRFDTFIKDVLLCNIKGAALKSELELWLESKNGRNYQ